MKEGERKGKDGGKEWKDAGKRKEGRKEGSRWVVGIRRKRREERRGGSAEQMKGCNAFPVTGIEKGGRKEAEKEH